MAVQTTANFNTIKVRVMRSESTNKLHLLSHPFLAPPSVVSCIVRAPPPLQSLTVHSWSVLSQLSDSRLVCVLLGLQVDTTFVVILFPVLLNGLGLSPSVLFSSLSSVDLSSIRRMACIGRELCCRPSFYCYKKELLSSLSMLSSPFIQFFVTHLLSSIPPSYSHPSLSMSIKETWNTKYLITIKHLNRL